MFITCKLFLNFYEFLSSHANAKTRCCLRAIDARLWSSGTQLKKTQRSLAENNSKCDVRRCSSMFDVAAVVGFFASAVVVFSSGELYTFSGCIAHTLTWQLHIGCCFVAVAALSPNMTQAAVKAALPTSTSLLAAWAPNALSTLLISPKRQ